MFLKNIIQKGVQLRIFLILLQYVANYFIQDHDANVFMYPSAQSYRTIWDDLIISLLSGLMKWDGQHFMHIALYGYTYENSLAFFPLLPVTVHYIASLYQIPFINFESQVLVIFTLFNFGMFVLTIIVLFMLTEKWFGKQKAQVCTLLFCINPASVFFTAAYTECLFSFLTFTSIYCCWKMHFNSFLVSSSWLFFSCLTIALSTLTRSNGLLNLGFLGYFFMRNLRNNISNNKSTLFIKLLKLACNLLVLILSLIICVSPFIILQFYHYSNFCMIKNIYLPQEVINYAHLNGYRLIGHYYNQSWCNYSFIPLPYSYVQEKYWNVGFFKYYELKQFPNFLLAFPVIYITLSESIKFLAENRDYLIHMGIFKSIFLTYFSTISKKGGTKTDHSKGQIDCKTDLMFVCVVHALFLCIFCIVYVHIQVTTRMLFSSNPVIYWFCLNKNKTFIKVYCFSYYIIGTVMFCNFLPWT